ncbi:PKD domain-containing protein [Halovulum sp. GXIMD14793]
MAASGWTSRVAKAGEALVLDAFASTDLDGDLLEGSWRLVSRPQGSTSVGVTRDDYRYALTPDIAGDYLLKLTVEDGIGHNADSAAVLVTTDDLRPVAVIEPASGSVGTPVTLDGGQSYDLDGSPVTHEWALLAAPSGSTAGLGKTDGVTSTLTPDVAGDYVVQLIVSDETGSGRPVTRLISTDAALPVAVAGPDASVEWDSVVTLDGSGSYSADTITSYDWDLIGLAGPVGSSGRLNGPEGSAVRELEPGIRTAYLHDVLKTINVFHDREFGGHWDWGLGQFHKPIDTNLSHCPPWHDGDVHCLYTPWQRTGVDVATAPVNLNPINLLHGELPPVLLPKGYVVLDDGSKVMIWRVRMPHGDNRMIRLELLDGSWSSEQVLLGGVDAYIRAPFSLMPMKIHVSGDFWGKSFPLLLPFWKHEFVCLGLEATVAQLQVRTATASSYPDTVYVGEGNRAPRALSVPAREVLNGQAVSINAADMFEDTDPLTTTWSLIARPQGSAASIGGRLVTGASAGFTPDRAGDYLLQAVAHDGDLSGQPRVLRVTVVNTAPVAFAGADLTAFVGETVTLNGSGSSDADGDPLSYAWSIASAPAGSSATLTNPALVTSDFKPDRRGSYVFELTVSDGLLSSTDNVTLTVPNRAPVASIEGTTSASTRETVSLSAAGSSDPDGDPLTYLWELTGKPSGSAASLLLVSDTEAGFEADLAGDYTMTLTVSDGLESATTTHTVSVTPSNGPPVLGPLQAVYTVEIGLELGLDIDAIDPDGDPIGFYARPLPLPQGVVLNTRTGMLSFRPETGQEGDYVLTVGASDGVLTDEKTITIRVIPANAGETAVTGVVLDAAAFAQGTETPLAGMPVRLKKAALMTVTAADGSFRFGGLTDGRDQVFIEPSANGGPGGYAAAHRLIRVTGNQIRDLSPKFLLTPLGDGCASVVSGQETVLTGTTNGVTVRIAADTVKDADGNAYGGQICLGTLPQLFEHEALPKDVAACQIYALDAPGAVFTQGVQVTAPNLDSLPETAELRFWQLRDRLSRFQIAGRAMVDTGAATVTTQTSVLKDGGTLFAFLPQAPRVTRSADQPGAGYQMLTPLEGDLSQGYAVTPYQSFGQAQSTALVYHSQAADPTLIIAGDVTVAANAGLPKTLSSTIRLAGLEIDQSPTWTPRQGANGQTPALLGEAVTLRQSAPVDAIGIPAGRHPLSFTTKAKYDCSTVVASYTGEAFVHNETHSPYGPGWSIGGLQKLVKNPDGTVAIITDDAITPFNPKPTFTEFESEPLVFDIYGEQGVNVADMDSDGLQDIVYGESGYGTVGIIANFGDRQFEKVREINVTTPASIPDDGGFYSPNLAGTSTGDINNDGISDVAFFSQYTRLVGFILNDGFGNFDKTIVRTGTRMLDGIFTDFDQDGRADYLATGTWGATSRLALGIHFNLSAGKDDYYQTWVKSALQIMSADFNGDGLNDIAARDRFGIDVFYFNGDRFVYGANDVGGASLNLLGRYADHGDFNNDGRLDFVLASGSEIKVILSTGASSYSEPIALTIPSDPVLRPRVFAFDVNGDGHIDVLHSTDNSIILHAGVGDGTFLPFETTEISHPIQDYTVADIDGDGSLDLISTSIFNLYIDFSRPTESGLFVAGAGDYSTLEQLSSGGWVRTYKDGTKVEFDANGLQTKTIDTNGNQITYAYDAAGRLTKATDAVGLETVYSYGPSGFLESITDPSGRVTSFGRNANGSIVQIVEPDTATIGFGYDEKGRMTSRTDQRGNTFGFAYGVAGAISGITTPDGASVAMSVGDMLGLENFAPGTDLKFVEPKDRITTVTDKRGGVTKTEVNEFGAVLRVTDPLGRVTDMQRNADNLVTRAETPYGSGDRRVDTMAYDTSGNLTALVEAVGTPQERSRSYVYGDLSRLIESTDPGGFVTRNEYDAKGNPTKTIMPEGDEVTMTYNSRGLMTAQTDPRGNTTVFDYDTKGNMFYTRNVEATVTQMEFTPAGLPFSTTEALDNPLQRTRMTNFDSKNRVTSQTDALNNTLKFGYDVLGNQVRFEDQAGRVATSVFDSMNRSAGGTDPMTGTSTVTHNAEETEMKVTDAAGREDVTELDILGRLSRTTEPHGAARQDGYDDADRLTAMTDAKGGQTTFEYDALGRAIRQTDPTGKAFVTEYDARDNVTRVVDADGDAATFTYDGNGRLKTMTTADNSYTYSYDPASNLTAIADSDTRIDMTYDAMNRVVTETVTYPGLAQPVTLTYAYDALSRRIRTSDSFGGVTEYTYDAENRQTRVTQPWGGAIDFTYDVDGRVLSKRYENGSATAVSYDAGGRLGALRHSFAGADFHHRSFGYDAAGRVILLKDEVEPARARTLSHDAGRRLVGVNEGVPAGDGGVPVPVEDYAYDLEDNRTASHLTSGYVYDNAHRLLETAAFSYTYDGNGNRVTRTDKSSGEVVSYGWDAQDQLVSVGSSEGWSLSFAYDAQQRRVGKTYTATDGTITTQVFVYDGPNVLFVFTTEGGVTKARRWMNAYGLDKRYGFEDYPSASPNPGNGMVYEVHQDYLGSIVAVVDPTTGTQVSRYRYDSFGQRTVISESVKPGYGFTGQQFDEETGLGYFRARYYDPKEGRFLSTDPLGFPDGPLNGYNYVAATPYQHVDPTGMSMAAPLVSTMVRQADITNEQTMLNAGIAGRMAALIANALLDAAYNFGTSTRGRDVNYPGISSVGTPKLDPPRGSNCYPLVDRLPWNLLDFDDTPTTRPHPPNTPDSDNDHDRAIETRRLMLLKWNKDYKRIKYSFIWKNREQRAAWGEKVSTCRPDLQYTVNYSLKYLEEYYRPGRQLETINKILIMNRADPLANLIGVRIGGRR